MTPSPSLKYKLMQLGVRIVSSVCERNSSKVEGKHLLLCRRATQTDSLNR